MVSYDEEFGELTIKTIDTLGLIIEIANERNYEPDTSGIYGNPTGILIGEVEDLIANLGNPLDISIIDNSNLIEGISTTQFPMYSKDKDTELQTAINSNSYSNWDDWVWLDTDVGIPSLGETKTTKNVCSVYEYNNKLSVVFIKQVQTLERFSSQASLRTVTEQLYVRHFDIDNSIMIKRSGLFYDNQIEEGLTPAQADEYMVDGTYGLVAVYSLYYKYINPGAAFVNPIKEGIELQITSNLTLTVGVDNYYSIEQDGNYLFYTGNAKIDNANVKRDEDITYKQVIDYLLILNNLFIESTLEGNLMIKNRTTTPSSFITISDSDIIKHTTSGIIKSNPDYTSICSVAEYSQESIATFLNFVYKILFSSLKANDYFEIDAEDYLGTLLLADGTTIDGINYKTNSVKLGNDRFIYQIKAWRT